MSADDLRDREQDPYQTEWGGKYSSDNLKESEEHPDAFPGGYKQDGSKNGRIPWQSRVTKKRGIIGGGLLAVIVAAIFGFSIISGPLQLIHLSQILSKNWQGQNDTAQVRLGRLIRFARTGDPGDLRVGRLGKAVVVRAINNLEAAGVTVLEKNIDGKPTKIRLNAAENSQFRAVPASQLKNAVVREYQLRASSVRVIGGHVLELTFDPGRASDIKSLQLIKAHTLKTSSGAVFGSIMSRKLGSFWGIGNLWHPLERRTTAIQGRPAQALTERIKAEEERKKQRIYARNQAEIGSTARRIGSALKGQTVMSALLVSGSLCAVRGVAGEVVKLNHLAIVQPAAAQAVDAIAIGSQIQAGQDFDAAQLGPIVNGFKNNKGETIWQGKALQVLTGSKNPAGADLPANYAQAFSNETTADNITDFIDSKLPLKAGKVICSPVGVGVQIALAVGAIAASVQSGGVTAQAYFALKTAAGLAATTGGLYLISSLLTDMIREKAVVPEALSGPLGGNLLAYGARAASNTAAIASGGTALEGSETTAYDQRLEEKAQQEFQSKNLAYRLFNVRDHRSAGAKLIDNVSPDPMQNFAKITNVVINFGDIIASSPSFLIPAAGAAEASYDWGFPRYGIPQNVAEDPEFEDPYENAELAKELIEGKESRLMDCFGVEIDKNNGWKVVSTKEVNPNADSYQGANCDDQSDNWRRIQLFIFDSQLMEAYACYEGETESCLGLNVEGAAQASTGAFRAGSSEGCTARGVVYPEQYTQQQLAAIFGNPGTSNNHPDMDARLVNINFLGRSVKINSLVAPCLSAVSKEIQSSNYKIREMGCYRFDADNPPTNIGLRSYHTYGAACDINWSTNPFVDGGTAAYDIPREFIEAFNKYGFKWGGDFKSVKDYMHFEWHGVIP